MFLEFASRLRYLFCSITFGLMSRAFSQCLFNTCCYGQIKGLDCVCTSHYNYCLHYEDNTNDYINYSVWKKLFKTALLLRQSFCSVIPFICLTYRKYCVVLRLKETDEFKLYFLFVLKKQGAQMKSHADSFRRCRCDSAPQIYSKTHLVFMRAPPSPRSHPDLMVYSITPSGRLCCVMTTY